MPRMTKQSMVQDLLAQVEALLPPNNPQEFKAYCQRWVDDLKPIGKVEEDLVHTLADSSWRRNRAAARERIVWSKFESNPALYSTLVDRLARVELPLSRLFHTAMDQLEKMQKARKKRKSLPRFSQPFDEVGFVLSDDEFDNSTDPRRRG